jgi:serine/threonine protein kinase
MDGDNNTCAYFNGVRFFRPSSIIYNPIRTVLYIAEGYDWVWARLRSISLEDGKVGTLLSKSPMFNFTRMWSLLYRMNEAVGPYILMTLEKAIGRVDLYDIGSVPRIVAGDRYSTSTDQIYNCASADARFAEIKSLWAADVLSSEVYYLDGAKYVIANVVRLGIASVTLFVNLTCETVSIADQNFVSGMTGAYGRLYVSQTYCAAHLTVYNLVSGLVVQPLTQPLWPDTIRGTGLHYNPSDQMLYSGFLAWPNRRPYNPDIIGISVYDTVLGGEGFTRILGNVLELNAHYNMVADSASRGISGIGFNVERPVDFCIVDGYLYGVEFGDPGGVYRLRLPLKNIPTIASRVAVTYNESGVITILGIVCGAVVLSVILLLICAYLCNRKTINNKSSPSSAESSRDIDEPLLTLNVSSNREPEGLPTFSKGELLGSGSSGSVYVGLCPNGALIAVKIVKVHLSTGTERVRALVEEVEVMKQIPPHPNVVRYFGCQVCEKSVVPEVHIFMEFVRGVSLGGLVRSMDVALPESIVRQYTRQLLLGLGHLHECEIIHRDIKGDNLLVPADGFIKLADFGTAKRFTALRTGTVGIVGTPLWMAPEVLTGTGSVTTLAQGTKSDVWSVGCTVVEMLNRGRPPWPEFESLFEAVLKIGSHEGLPPNIPEGLSTDCTSFLTRCFERDPENRAGVSELLGHPFVSSGSSSFAQPSPIHDTVVNVTKVRDAILSPAMGGADIPSVPTDTALGIRFHGFRLNDSC